MKLSDFTTSTSILDTDYIIGFQSAATPGSERKWTLSTIKANLETKYSILKTNLLFVRFDGTGATGSKALIVDGSGGGITVNKTAAGAYTLTIATGVFSAANKYATIITAAGQTVSTTTYTSGVSFGFTLAADSSNITVMFLGI